MNNGTSPYRDLDFPAFIASPVLKSFIGKNESYYRALWSKDFEKYKGRAERIIMAYHWNTLAVLWAPAWFGYRKMVAVAGLWTGLIVLSIIVAAWRGWVMPPGIIMAANAVLALRTKSLYFDRAARFVQRSRDLPPDRLADVLRKQGGTSVMAAILVGALSIAAVAGALAIAYFMNHAPTMAVGDSRVIPA